MLGVGAYIEVRCIVVLMFQVLTLTLIPEKEKKIANLK